MSDLEVLRIIGVKGRVTPETVSASLGADSSGIDERCRALVASGHCVETPGGLRISPSGKEYLAELLERERADVDVNAMSQAYEEFAGYNGELKSIITAWQMKDADTPNDHSDESYDAEVLSRLTDLHRRVRPLLERFGALAPRLARYRDRLDLAVDKVAAGEHSWVARPIMDSYHTVWFELHEDLIALCGLSRQDEAASGRAQ
ncbi:hypothetical protein H0B56_13410 [Haloechinothrix sp. YIM 98757]|uniref:Uncharacterized protein n=1 Tax=Haloechinothrix aidingensis TaxID=2752311 RepID=A0A838ABC5_9PSEU|nr:hypothetical protein [Haloechinothrix aidingensis]MBA0126543.1 hypothetical protein [Haloechinothrix aidingensis]